jgi:hypothetical protein
MLKMLSSSTRRQLVVHGKWLAGCHDCEGVLISAFSAHEEASLQQMEWKNGCT